MRVTLRDLLRNCRLALKKFLNKRDKWVKEWAGQVSRGRWKRGSKEELKGSCRVKTESQVSPDVGVLPPVLGEGLATPRAGPLAPARRPEPHPSVHREPVERALAPGPGRGWDLGAGLRAGWGSSLCVGPRW